MNTDKAYAEMINERFKASLSAIQTADPSREILTSEKYLRPYLSFIRDNMRAYRVIHLKDSLFRSQKTFESFYESVFSPALSHFGVAEAAKKYVFAFYTQGTVAICVTTSFWPFSAERLSPQQRGSPAWKSRSGRSA